MFILYSINKSYKNQQIFIIIYKFYLSVNILLYRKWLWRKKRNFGKLFCCTAQFLDKCRK